MLLHPDESVTGAIRCVFERFAELGSVRRVWLWLRSEGWSFPAQYTYGQAIRWGAPSYTAIHNVLTSPVYAGAYVFGKTRHERVLDEEGEAGQEGLDLGRAHLLRVPLAMEQNKAFNPVRIGFLGADAVPLAPDAVTNAVKQLRRIGRSGSWWITFRSTHCSQ